jgi:predicted transcriptional regulator
MPKTKTIRQTKQGIIMTQEDILLAEIDYFQALLYYLEQGVFDDKYANYKIVDDYCDWLKYHIREDLSDAQLQLYENKPFKPKRT